MLNSGLRQLRRERLLARKDPDLPVDRRAGLSSRGVEAVRALVDATLSIVAAEGVKSVTHRKVVAAAGQSLGITHYYFSSLDDLLLESFSHYVDRMVAQYSAALDAATDEDELLDAMMVLIDSVRSDNRSAVLMYELYAQGVRDERFGMLTERWSRESKRSLSRFCSEQTASEIETIWDGMIVQSLLTKTAPPDTEVKKLMRIILDRDTQAAEPAGAEPKEPGKRGAQRGASTRKARTRK